MLQQELVWVRLPFSNLRESKIRPAVIVSNDHYNSEGSDVVVCAVTSNLKPKGYSVALSQENLASGKLPIKSRVRADKILQIEKSLVIRPFARLNDKTFNALIAEIIRLLKRS